MPLKERDKVWLEMDTCAANIWLTYGKAALRAAIITWIAPTDIVDRLHDTVYEQRQANTGDWFLQREDYQSWRMRENSFLWLNGIPGCGKTVLW